MVSIQSGSRAERPIKPLTVGLTGALALAVAMGIGRFAFTPLLPMMLADKLVDLPGGGWLATANYLGYLLGALLCMILPRFADAAAMVRLGLAGTIVVTLGMALPWPDLWPVLRFLAGVMSAFVFIFTSGWCVARLARLDAQAMGALIFIGPGLGIILSGLMTSGMVALHWTASTGWAVLGLLALVLTVVVWPVFRGGEHVGIPAPGQGAGVPARGSRVEQGLFTLAYGLAGLGYIITATFLPVIAREALPGSIWLDLFWPVFGLGIMLGAVISTRIPVRVDPRLMLIGLYLLQAAGVMMALWLPSAMGFALGSLMVGVPMTAITFFAMQIVRRLRPDGVAAFMGLLTVLYGLGQIAGPPLAAALLARADSHAQGFALSLECAALSLVIGVLIYLWLIRAYPAKQEGH
ncbi:YbfB/YjiJ family MFS transporter [Oleomonas cavernae]|uniref:YbfB/YjiJ family MFS transporter n=1 Tax=Oleomonas cavernae TaxID=2320859 RepID=A0A418WBE9_9PROT|nr:YbfB/YjiJ family MFS transporter [Oleomonas cavernae]RJF87294.1 YbfB/YjiJ family MFS transporter [Oleomonas cavernae]